MTTTVTYYVPYVMDGKVVRVSQRSPKTGLAVGPEIIIPREKANTVQQATIHDGAMLLIEEVNAPPVVLPADPAPGAEAAPADVVNAAITGG